MVHVSREDYDKVVTRWYEMSDHEYKLCGECAVEEYIGR